MLRVNKHYVNPETDFDWDAFIKEKLGEELYTGEDIDIGDVIEDIAYDSSPFVDYTADIGSNKDYKIYSYKNLKDYVKS